MFLSVALSPSSSIWPPPALLYPVATTTNEVTSTFFCFLLQLTAQQGCYSTWYTMSRFVLFSICSQIWTQLSQVADRLQQICLQFWNPDWKLSHVITLAMQYISIYRGGSTSCLGCFMATKSVNPLSLFDPRSTFCWVGLLAGRHLITQSIKTHPIFKILILGYIF